MQFEDFRDDSSEAAETRKVKLLSPTLQRLFRSSRIWARVLAFSLIAMFVINTNLVMMIVFLDEGLFFIGPILIQSGFLLLMLGGPVITLFVYGQRIGRLLKMESDDYLPVVFAAQRWMWTVLAMVTALWGLLIGAVFAWFTLASWESMP